MHLIVLRCTHVATQQLSPSSLFRSPLAGSQKVKKTTHDREAPNRHLIFASHLVCMIDCKVVFCRTPSVPRRREKNRPIIIRLESISATLIRPGAARDDQQQQGATNASLLLGPINSPHSAVRLIGVGRGPICFDF